MRFLFKILAAASFLYMPIQAGAWGMLGHRIVGRIAETYLTEKAQKAVREILGDESLAIAANWADFIKSDPASAYLSPWHYIDLKDSLSSGDIEDYLQKDTATDACTRINFLVKELKGRRLPMEKKKLYLRLLIHIVGDIHQPMHVGRPGDQGGNAIKVFWFNDPVNLHSVWDEKLINYQQLSYTEYAAAINHADKARRLAWQNQPLVEWIVESYKLSRQIYAEIGQPDQRLGYRYNFDHIQTVNEQLLKAGVRLAGLLNRIFAS